MPFLKAEGTCEVPHPPAAPPCLTEPDSTLETAVVCLLSSHPSPMADDSAGRLSKPPASTRRAPAAAASLTAHLRLAYARRFCHLGVSIPACSCVSPARSFGVGGPSINFVYCDNGSALTKKRSLADKSLGRL